MKLGGYARGKSLFSDTSGKQKLLLVIGIVAAHGVLIALAGVWMMVTAEEPSAEVVRYIDIDQLPTADAAGLLMGLGTADTTSLPTPPAAPAPPLQP